MHDGKGMFIGVKNPFLAARYHSLALESCPMHFELRATARDGEIMAIQHEQYPLYGVQFHPESFLTEQGDILMRNFLSLPSHENGGF
jgi:anthranilate synthase/phosphoribosyltransferase